VRVHAYRDSNKRWSPLWNFEQPSPCNSKQKKGHADEGSVFSSGQRSVPTRPCNSRPCQHQYDGRDTVKHPSYSPDLAPSDYHFFPTLKSHPDGTSFRTEEELKEEVVVHRDPRVLWHGYEKKNGVPHAKMHRSQRGLCRKTEERLGFPTMYNSFRINVFFFVKKNPRIYEYIRIITATW